MSVQTRWESFQEQLFNIGSGFILSYLTWKFMLHPLITHGKLSIDDSFIITSIFTAISVVRGYIWRRAYNKKTLKKLQTNGIIDNPVERKTNKAMQHDITSRAKDPTVKC